MVYDITYTDRMVNIEIIKLVGRPFGWLSKVRWQGIGSERCKVLNASGAIAEIFEGDYGRNFTNIEIRQGGIVVRIRYRLEVFAVVFKFGELKIHESEEGLVLIGGENQMLLRGSRGHLVNSKFVEKIKAFAKRKANP